MAWFFSALLLCVSSSSFARDNERPAKAILVIRGVTIIDVARGTTLEAMTVVVEDDRITEVGKVDAVAIPKNAMVIEVKGKLLIPGLWDMHAHVEAEAILPLFVGNGVTGVRHMFTGSPLNPPVKDWGKEVARGKRIGPRIVATTRAIDGLNGDKPAAAGHPIVATTPEEGRAAVKTLRDAGDDFVKVYPFLNPEVFFAVLDEAARGPRKLPVAGHVPHLVSAAEASDRGMRSMEHCYGVLLCCSKEEEKLRKELAAAVKSGAMVGDTLDSTGAWRNQVKAMDSYDPTRAAELFKKFVKNDTWQVPTLISRKTWASLGDPKFTDDPRKAYLPLHVRTTWFQRMKGGGVQFPLFGDIRLSPGDLANQKLLFQAHMKLVGAMNKAGVKILAGTDTPVPYCFPGSGVHDELELLVKAGLTPAEALRTATLNPPIFLDRLRDHGTVEKGKLADLVLLEANPLEDINNVRKIETVILGGRLFSKMEIEKMAHGEKP
ncbi:MAG TPA: amidohydrolase family protein [Gemmata sp.]|nr:amidohydrolase family protein [Gemmata sp.]